MNGPVIPEVVPGALQKQTQTFPVEHTDLKEFSQIRTNNMSSQFKITKTQANTQP